MKQVTQEDWTNALIYAWNHHRSLGGAVANAFGYLDSDDKTSLNWEGMVQQIFNARLYPILRPHVLLKQSVATWIATKCMHANNALWDGKIDVARRWLMSGKDVQRPTIRRRLHAETKPSREDKTKMRINVRDRDTRHGWHKVK